MANWYHYAAALGLAAAQSFAAAAQETAAPTIGPASQEQVILEADYVYEIRDENLIVAEGNVEALYDGRTLRADRLVYNRATERVRATGNVVIIESDGTQQFSDEVEVGSNLSDGYAIGYSARLAGGATVVANSAIRQSNGINAMDQVVYTACPICAEDVTPTWSLRARRAVLDQESQMISYRDAVLEVMGLPVFYFPFLAHPDPSSDRRSGLLIPSAGVSSKLGLFYQQPYYWAISEHSDLTISPLITENVNPMMELDYRKRFYSGSIDINTSFTHEADFDTNGDRFGDEKWRGHLYGSGRFALSPEWQWGFGVETQTDDLYDRRYDISGQGERRGIYVSQPRRLLSQLYAVGQGDSYYSDVSLLSFQGLRAGDTDGSLPTVTPLFFGEKYWDLGNFGFASVNASTAILTRDVGEDSQRVSVGADWSDLNILPGGFTFEPFAELRADYYALDAQYAGQDNVSRVVGNTGARLSYPMVRPGKVVDISIEPTLMAAWGFSNINDPVIPNEDSLLFEADESLLFEPSATTGFDLYEGDGKLSAGLTARAVWKNGVELSTTVGRRWRSRPDAAFNAVSNLDGTSSDWVVSNSADFGRPLRIETRMRLDEDGFSLNRIDARFSTNFKRLRATGQYYKIDQRISPLGRDDEGIFLRGEVRVTDRYSLIYGELRDIAEDIDARKEIGIAYEDECSRLELVYSRSEIRDRTLGPSENIQIRFSLKTLGEFGSNEFD
ncbi:MAG: LPS assembly protein LptD [Hyphomonas sp.]|uniref:LPS-assembly protein LptD n=1 Tax=Hyphomonas sp. TaxID=87 RepID=UPI003527D633